MVAWIKRFILLWLLFAALAGGRTWTPPGGWRAALEKKHEIEAYEQQHVHFGRPK